MMNMRIIDSGRIIRVKIKDGVEYTEIPGIKKINYLVGRRIVITKGKGAGQNAGIRSNDMFSVVTEILWGTRPDATSEYQIIDDTPVF